MPIGEVLDAVESDDVATRAQRAVVRLEQALSAVSAAAVGQTTATAVQVDPGPHAEGATGDTSLEAAHATRAVARFEDVMRIAPTRPAIAPTPAAPLVQEAQPAAAPAPVDLSPAPVEVVKPVAPASEPEPEPAPEPEPLAARASVPPPTPAPFWFECMATVAPEAAEASATETERRLHSIAPPAFHAEREEFVRPRAERSRRTWAAALCLLLLAGVIVVLTGRAPPR